MLTLHLGYSKKSATMKTRDQRHIQHTDYIYIYIPNWYCWTHDNTSVVSLICLVSLTWHRQLKEGRVDLGSQYKGAVHHVGETVGGWHVSQLVSCICSQEAKRAECCWPAPFLLFINSETRAHGLVCTHSGLFFLPQLNISVSILTDKPGGCC